MSGTLRFNIDEVRKLVKNSASDKPLQLVGDQGVYLMSFDVVGEKIIVYANGAHPDVNDGWYDVKGRIFGYDDGCDQIGTPDELKSVIDSCARHLVVKITAKSVIVKADQATPVKVNASLIPEHLRHLIKS